MACRILGSAHLMQRLGGEQVMGAGGCRRPSCAATPPTPPHTHVPAFFPHASAAACALMCDDDNDLPLAALVGRAFVPGFTADSVVAAAEADPARFHVTEERSVFGAEEILRLLLAEAGSGARRGRVTHGGGGGGRAIGGQLAA